MNQSDVEVLLAEDNPGDAELVRHSLAGALLGRLHHVRDGVEALEFLFRRGAHAGRSGPPPRLVLLDVKLPMVDGFQVLRELRADPRTQALPVVFLSSSKLAADVLQGYRLGANSYVQKPVEFVQFREAVHRIGQYWLGLNQPPPAQAFEGTAP
jgi:two-component system response regulator